ncbi:hypothetical protein ACHAXN_000652 [Cyclotella atomus]
MIMFRPLLPTALAALAHVNSASACTSVEYISCSPVNDAPTLDGDNSDWSSVETFQTSLAGALTAAPYPNDNLKVQCVYDDDRIYFLFEVPGVYRFDTTDNHKCAAISTMFKMGEEAMLYNMGNCPMAATSCPSNPEDCVDYKVDIGGHWELATTEMGVAYGINNGTGDDAVANKDDEYAVSPYCRFDDDDQNAANEWAGAWAYVNETGVGSYIFEMSRLLSTASTESDAQLVPVPGQAIDFGFAFWDPYEDVINGWSDAGHYVTGCAADWISLQLVDKNGEVAPAPSPSGAETTLGESIDYSDTTDVPISDIAEDLANNDVETQSESDESSATVIAMGAVYFVACALVMAFA